MSDTTNQNSKQEKTLFSDTNINKKTGNLVADPEMVGDGKFIKITIANNKRYLENGEERTITNYFDVLVSTALEDTAQLAQSLKKGDWVFIQGSDGTEKFDTAEGYRKQATTIFAYKVELRRKKGQAQQPVQSS